MTNIRTRALAFLVGLLVFALSWGLIAAALALAVLGLSVSGGGEGEGGVPPGLIGALDPARTLPVVLIVGAILALVATLLLAAAATVLLRVYRGLRRRGVEAGLPDRPAADDRWPY